MYTGDTDASSEEILMKAEKTFNIRITKKVKFVQLYTRCLVEAKFYPMFTLLGQTVGSIVLGVEALSRCRPDVFIDTMG